MARKANGTKSGSAANLGFEARLWQAADALRNNMDAAEYKHVVLGLIFLRYVTDAFEAQHAELAAQNSEGADPEDPDEYRAGNIFWVPKEARWSHLKASAPQPTIGKLVDDTMAAIERDNASLKGVLPKDFARIGLDKQRLGQLVNLKELTAIEREIRAIVENISPDNLKYVDGRFTALRKREEALQAALVARSTTPTSAPILDREKKLDEAVALSERLRDLLRRWRADGRDQAGAAGEISAARDQPGDRAPRGWLSRGDRRV